MSASLVSINWSVPPATMAGKTLDYGKRLLEAVLALGTYFAAKLEAYAKANASWTDRTGHARQSLIGMAVKTAAGVVIILAGLASYSIWLEIANAGRYAIILRTIEAHHAMIFAALRALIR
jgi:hypothetical protein